MTDLTDLETAVLRKLLSGHHQVLALLRQQLDVCRVREREFTGVGFYTYFDMSSCTGPRPELDLKFGDVVAEIGGLQHGAGFVLYVESGLLAMLEGYTYGEPWPDRIESFKLSYDGGEERDWQTLTYLLDKSK
jgi:hypothetical protein